MGVFDQASHYAVKLDPEGFFAWRLPQFTAQFTFLGWLDVSTIAFPGEPNRVCDTVAEFGPRDGVGARRILDVECQSEPDPDMLERLGEYSFRLRREVRHGIGQAGKYQVLGVLLNLTGPEQSAELDLREPSLSEAGLYFRAVQFTLREEDAAETLKRIASEELARCVLPWIPLMRGGAEMVILEEWKRIALSEPDAKRRADFGGLALVFAELAGRRDVWRQTLEDWNVQVSQQVLEWQAKARQEGEREGERAGELVRCRKDVTRALEVRFRAPVPSDLAEQVAAQSDLGVLARWFDAAVTADSLAAFRATIGT
jgi:hypothetical protein